MDLIQVETYSDNALKIIDEDNQEIIFEWNGSEVIIK
jgi:hypothetical protein